VVETVTLDDLDLDLVHALQIDGRAPFSRVADVLDVSESTVARRYRRLRSAGALRIVGEVNGFRLGYVSWTVRLRCTPDVADAVSSALARRTDTFWVHLLSGGTEISCNTQAHADDDNEILLEKLPRTNRILAVSAHSILGGGSTASTAWAGLHHMSDEQVAALEQPEPTWDVNETLTLDPNDELLLAALSRDGRASYSELAGATGWSESTVRRRMDHLRDNGVLSFEVDIAPKTLGYRAEARLWMSVRPAAVLAVTNALSLHPEVSFAAITTGPTNVLAEIVCRSSHELYRYLTERIATLEDIQGIETAPVVRTVKRAGAILPR